MIQAKILRFLKACLKKFYEKAANNGLDLTKIIVNWITTN